MRTHLATSAGLLFALTLAAPNAAQAQQSRTWGSIVVVSEGKSWEWAAKVLQAVEKNPKGMTTSRLVLERGRPSEPPVLMRSLLARIRRARRLIFKLKLPPAINRLQQVIAEIKKLMARKGATPGLLRRYLQAWNYLGAAHQLNADAENAQKAFRIVLSIDPTRKLKPKFFTAEVIAGFDKFKSGLQRNTSLRINTDKPALVFVDGQLRGVAPTVITGLVKGEHVVELRRLGYLRITRFVDTDTAGGSIRARVVKDLSKAALRQQMKLVEKALRRSKQPKGALAALAKLLGVNQVLVCRAGLDDGEATLFDADRNKFVKRVRRISALPGSPPAAAIATALGRATPVIDLQGGPAASGGACEDSEDCTEGYCSAGRCVSEEPIYKKWWFWTLIGAAAAAVTTGGVLLGRMPQRPVIQIRLGER